jgi:hypothetical protein
VLGINPLLYSLEETSLPIIQQALQQKQGKDAVPSLDSKLRPLVRHAGNELHS